MKLLAAAVSMAMASAVPSVPLVGGGPTWCIVRGSEKVLLTDTCASLKGSAKVADIAGMPGEAEHVQIVVDAGLATGTAPFSLKFAALTSDEGGSIPASAFQASVVGHVNCTQTTRYSPSGGGWHPDPLFPLPTGGAVTVQPNATASFFVRGDIPRSAAAGTYSGTWTVGFGGTTWSVDATVAVWATSLPEPSQMYKAFGEIWSFTTNDFTGPNTTNATTVKYLDMMTDHLVPPDALYKDQPYRDFGMYKYLNATGKFLLNLADISNLDGTYDRECTKAYTPEYIESTLAMLEPTVNALKNSGILDSKQAYVYGYDEQPASCEKNIRALFGAVKAKWPFVTTAAVLNWAGGLPVDLPVDVWILQYEVFDAASFKRWKAAGKRQFWYHCIEPSKSAYLNTFIERPWIQGRQLYWLASSANVDGWLYYATDLWKPYPGSTIEPISLLPDSTLTAYAVANYIWSPRTDIFANGDGQFIYPGRTGPVGTARLANIRDAVEDQALLQAVRNAGKAAALEAEISKIVRSPTDHTDDPVLLEATRRAIAALLS